MIVRVRVVLRRTVAGESLDSEDDFRSGTRTITLYELYVWLVIWDQMYAPDHKIIRSILYPTLFVSILDRNIGS